MTIIDRLDVERMIAQLGERDQSLVRALAIEGRSVRETAAALNMSEGAVRVALHRAIKRLAGSLSRRGVLKTDALIDLLVADLEPSRLRFRTRLRLELACGAAAAGLILLSVLHLRPDLGAQLASPRLWLKLATMLTLTAASLGLVRRLATPGAEAKPWLWATWPRARSSSGLALLAEALATPASSWPARLVGHNAFFCVTLIPLLSAAPLACLLHVLRRGAPADPGLAGAAAGLLASGVGATLYALHCIDDSPFFVAAWYSLAIAIVTLVGYVAGRRWLRW